jgi:hypothetical protein
MASAIQFAGHTAHRSKVGVLISLMNERHFLSAIIIDYNMVVVVVVKRPEHAS